MVDRIRARHVIEAFEAFFVSEPATDAPAASKTPEQTALDLFHETAATVPAPAENHR